MCYRCVDPPDSSAVSVDLWPLSMMRSHQNMPFTRLTDALRGYPMVITGGLRQLSQPLRVAKDETNKSKAGITNLAR